MLTGAYLDNQFAADVKGVEAMRMKAIAGDPATLKSLARQFEAMMVQTMLKTARASSLAGADDPFGSSTDMKFYHSLLDQQWAQNIASGKGLGLADMLMKQLAQNTATDAAKSASGLPLAGAAKDVANLKGAVDKAMPLDVNALKTVEPPLYREPAARPDDTSDDALQGWGTQASSGEDPKQRFIEAMLPHAQAAERATGVPARFVLAQAALESGWGRHEIKAADGTTSHNLFGIKAGSGWDGGAVSAVTTEYRQGLAMKISARFRAYADYAEAFTDYARLLKRRYQGVVEAGSDALAFVRGLANGGYATDPAYAAKLRGVIRSVEAAGA